MFYSNEIISYTEMCSREGCSLQRGMNFRRTSHYSVILMSRRKNAPYRDILIDDGKTLIYEGHDVPRAPSIANPKIVDQKSSFPSGKLTQNGLFYQAAIKYKVEGCTAELVRVYEKILQGIWSYTGLFLLTDSWKEQSEGRDVFKFKLMLQDDEKAIANNPKIDIKNSRVIPTSVKIAVWKRDKGRCVICGATDELHFDHILPYSKGGTSITPENVQILCARHNLQKSNKIE